MYSYVLSGSSTGLLSTNSREHVPKMLGILIQDTHFWNITAKELRPTHGAEVLGLDFDSISDEQFNRVRSCFGLGWLCSTLIQSGPSCSTSSHPPTHDVQASRSCVLLPCHSILLWEATPTSLTAMQRGMPFHISSGSCWNPTGWASTAWRIRGSWQPATLSSC